jgi:hypothetical protein
MSAPLSGPLFHGTIETLKEGQQIRPRTGTWAWATSDLHAAIAHTQDRTRSGLGEKSGGEYPVHHGNIYEVEPIHVAGGVDPTIQTETMSGTQGAIASQLGFKVKKHIASVPGPEDDRKTLKKHYPSFDPSRESYLQDGRNRPPEA